MIIFNLDGTLANCEHRRHFVDPDKHPDFNIGGIFAYDYKGRKCNQVGEPFKPDWQSFYEACDKDEPLPTCTIFNIFHCSHICNDKDVHIWSARCESVRDKTQKWIRQYCSSFFDFSKLKMRPIGDSIPDDVLKERWINDLLSDYGRQFDHEIDFVFDSDPKSIAMWRRRGIFVFDCNQDGREF